MSLRTILGVARNDLHEIRSAWRTTAMSPVGDDDVRRVGRRLGNTSRFVTKTCTPFLSVSGLSVVVRIEYPPGACNTEQFCLNFWQRSLRNGEKSEQKTTRF